MRKEKKGGMNMRILWFIVLLVLLIFLILLFYTMGNDLIGDLLSTW